MTEPAVASSDATNIEARIERRGDEYVINGRKWWTSGAGDPRCKIYVFMGKTDPEAPRHSQQSMVLVPRRHRPGITDPASALGVRLRRRAARPHGGAVRERPRPDLQRPARRRPRLRDRAGPSGPGADPPLHAPDRPGRALARDDVQARDLARRLRPHGRRAGRDARAHRRGALPDRHGAPADAEGGVDDGRRRQQGGEGRDRDDQGRRAEHGLPGDRLGDPGARRRRRLRRLPARRLLRRARARCASPTGPTRCTATRSPRSSSASTAEAAGATPGHRLCRVRRGAPISARISPSWPACRRATARRSRGSATS